MFKLQDIPANVEKVLHEEYIKADKIMLVLLFGQWLVTTFFLSQTYDTQLYGFIGGGFIFGFNLALFKFNPGSKATRYSIAVAMMLFSLIFIQQQLGRIEMHFHIFGALAFLTIYKDMYPVLIAALTSIIHHVLFNLLQLYGLSLFDVPVIIFNYGCGWDIVFIHGVFVVVEATVLIYIILVQINQYKALINSEQKLQITHEALMVKNDLNKSIAKQAEEFAHALDESSIISKTDPKGRITYVNNKFCEISGYTREELIGKKHDIIRHPDMSSKVFENLWNTILSKKVFKALIKNKKKNGDAYYIDSIITPILDVNNEIVEYIAARYEVTDLVKARDDAQMAEVAKDNFLANMSHELRTPLNAIMGFTKMSLKRVPDVEVQKFLETSLESSYGLLELINTILDISKIKSGTFNIAHHPFKLKMAMQNLFNSFEPAYNSKSIIFKNDFKLKEDISLNGDWQCISQIITNLMSNAIKFTPENGNVTLETSYENGYLKCVVIDSGIGLSEEEQERVFTPFEQADSSTMREYGGTGLGLSISLELAKLMNGNIRLESKKGKGSTFTLEVPLELLEEELQKLEHRPGEIVNLHGRVLVAEDNKTNQMLIKLLLADIGLECDIAEDGLVALDMYGKKKYDIVLMDENMPNMNGTQAMLSIREKFTNVAPIIALTSNNMQGDREKFLEAGMDDFISKPIDDDILYAVLAKYLG